MWFLLTDCQYSSLKHVSFVLSNSDTLGQELEEALLMHSILPVHFVSCLAAKRGTSF